jgi:hypothetical protein
MKQNSVRGERCHRHLFRLGCKESTSSVSKLSKVGPGDRFLPLHSTCRTHFNYVLLAIRKHSDALPHTYL